MMRKQTSQKFIQQKGFNVKGFCLVQISIRLLKRLDLKLAWGQFYKVTNLFYGLIFACIACHSLTLHF